MTTIYDRHFNKSNQEMYKKNTQNMLNIDGLMQERHTLNMLNIDGLMQERRNSIANALELCLSCTNPSIYSRYSFCIVTR